MKSDDPKLTAYALGELSPRESHEVKMAIENRPDLQQEVDDIRAFEALFGKKDKLTPEQRAAVFQFGNSDDKVVEFPLKRRRFGVVALLGAAAAVVVSLTLLRAPQQQAGSGIVEADWSDWSDTQLLQRMGINLSPWNQQNVSASDKKQNAEKLKVHAASYRSESQSRAEKANVSFVEKGEQPAEHWVEVAKVPVARVPLIAGNASYTWVRESVENGKLPHPSLVREEELLNVSVPKLQADMIVGGVAGGVELVQSPWDEKSLLAFVRIAAENKALTQVAVTFSDNVQSYRSLGYSTDSSGLAAPVEQQVQHSHLAVYELQMKFDSLDNAAEIVTLEMQVRAGGAQESDALRVLYTAPHWSKVSHKGLRHSVLVATWAKWLKQTSNEVLKNALEVQVEQATTSNADQRHTLSLIEQCLELQK